MGFTYWLRTGIMTMAFIGVVIVIREFNQPISERRTQLFSFLGSPPDPTVATVNLCPTRITKFTLEDGTVILQRGLDWTRIDPSGETKLDQVAVEKWFSAYCLFEGKKVSPSADVKTVLKLAFVNGPPRALIRSASGSYEWADQPFRSELMTAALKALGEFPTAVSK